jgi:hypothetical protein
MHLIAPRLLPAFLVGVTLAGMVACDSRHVFAAEPAVPAMGDAARVNTAPTAPTAPDAGNEIAERTDGPAAKAASTSADAGRPQKRAPVLAKPKPGTMCGHSPNEPGCDCFGAHPDPTCGDP